MGDTKAGIDALERDSPTFPDGLMRFSRLSQIYYKGQIEKVDWERSVAIVGSRSPSLYGITVCLRVVKELLDAGFTPVTGFAYGIDMEVIKLWCRLARVRTKLPIAVAVLPCGLNHISPSSERQTFASFLKLGGVLITEYPPSHPPFRWTYVQRNRLIAALGGSTLIVEAKANGGSMNCAGWTQKLGKPLFAVPGPITSETSTGCNMLIAQNKAQLLYSSSQLTQGSSQLSYMRASSTSSTHNQLGPEYGQLLSVVVDQPRSFDQLVKLTRVDPVKVSQRLTLLELDGHIYKSGELYHAC